MLFLKHYKLTKMNIRFVIALASLFSTQIIAAQAPLVEDLGYRGGSIPGIKKTAKAINFLVIGDWGRNGENYQKEVAAGMGKAAHDLHADFIIATGDNFYPYGVASTADHHWISSYENIYTAQSLHVKWYPVLGNHDYATNPDAQVAYSKISSRWDMPARYYSKQFYINGDTAQSLLIAFIDTDPFEKKMRGQANDSLRYPVGATEAQQAWLEKLLSSSKAKWKMVVGHHPLYTGGWRINSPDTKNMRALLEPVFKKYQVDAYICGHEHHLEYSRPAGATHYILSGAGSEARPARINPEGGQFVSTEQGFAALSVTASKIVLQFINHRHKVVYETTIEK
jgi:tartrate-resistant acid phosphatase type 5